MEAQLGQLAVLTTYILKMVAPAPLQRRRKIIFTYIYLDKKALRQTGHRRGDVRTRFVLTPVLPSDARLSRIGEE